VRAGRTALLLPMIMRYQNGYLTVPMNALEHYYTLIHFVEETLINQDILMIC